jgi:porphobilinogen synthase
MEIRNRMRRLRRSPAIRDIVRETSLSVNDFIYPLFIVEGSDVKEEISSMPGVYHFSLDMLDDEITEAKSLGIKSFLIFGVPEEKDPVGSGAYDEDGIVQRAVRSIKERHGDVVIITDVCLCAYTDHGHCGVVVDGRIRNDESVALMVKTAVSHARAGADIVAPSDMMDGRVGEIRKALDSNALDDVSILAYSAKFASSFYGPFRDAAHSSPQFGDRKEYQMDVANGREAMREIELDIEEGADMVMVKPALSYLDVIKEASTEFRTPLVAYNVSGEYAMIKAAGSMGLIDEKSVALEVLTSIKRAGAGLIITYFAKDAARWLAGK